MRIAGTPFPTLQGFPAYPLSFFALDVLGRRALVPERKNRAGLTGGGKADATILSIEHAGAMCTIRMEAVCRRAEGKGEGRGEGRRGEGRKAVDVDLKGLEDGKVSLSITPVKPRERPAPRERRPRNPPKVSFPACSP